MPWKMFRVCLLQVILTLLWCTLVTGRRKGQHAKGKLEIFPPLAYDSWEKGHELPDVVAGRIFSSIVFLRVVNKGKRIVENVTLAVKGSRYVASSMSEVPIDVQGGQRVSLHAPLRQVVGTSIPTDACPFKIRLEVRIGNDVATVKSYKLLCRAIHDRITFVYLDTDRSPQIAAAKFPKVASKYDNRTGCPEAGCAVLLSTHGMDVTAQRQVDCYRPKLDMWVLAPHGRGTHGVNWQGPGHWSALRALESLSTVASRWTLDNVNVANRPWKVIFTGHSNGGFGAWLLGSHYPDMALGVSPLAGMTTLGTTEFKRPPRVQGKVEQIWRIVDSSVAEYRGEALAKNMLNIPFFARTGLLDRVIDPRATKNMGAIFASAGITWSEKRIKKPRGILWKSVAGIEKRVVFLEGKEHWWWDTTYTNDGGALDDGQLRKFWKRVLRIEKQQRNNYTAPVHFSCANPVSCGSSAGFRILSQLNPGRMSSFEISYSKKSHTIFVQTFNVGRLRVLNTTQYSGSFEDLVLDNQNFSLSTLVQNRDFIDFVHGIQVKGKWSRLSKEKGVRSDDIERYGGPIRRVFAAPFAIVYGTIGAKKATKLYRREAIRFANSWAMLVGGTIPIVSDKDFARLDPILAQNIILFGGKGSNYLSREISFPFRSLSKLRKYEIEGGFGIGTYCNFTGPDIGIVSLGSKPIFDKGERGLAVMVAGTTLGGFEKAVELFRSNMFHTNSWQHRLPDFIVAGTEYETGSRQIPSLEGVLAAGYWGDNWEYLENASASLNGNCNSYHMP